MRCVPQTPTQLNGGRVADELIVTSCAGGGREHVEVARIGDKREVVPMTKRQVIELKRQPLRCIPQTRVEGNERVRECSEVGVITRVTDIEVGGEHWGPVRRCSNPADYDVPNDMVIEDGQRALWVEGGLFSRHQRADHEIPGGAAPGHCWMRSPSRALDRPAPSASGSGFAPCPLHPPSAAQH